MRTVATAERVHPGLFPVVESWVCGLLAILLLFEITVGLLLVVIDFPSASFHLPRWLTVPMLATFAPVNFILLARVWDGLKRSELPLPLAVAQAYLPATGLYRLFYGGVFLFYAACGIAMAWGFTAAIDSSIQHGLEAGAVVGLVIIGIGFSFLANLLVVLLLAVLTNRLAAARWFWAHRLYLDLAIGLGVSLRAFL